MKTPALLLAALALAAPAFAQRPVSPFLRPVALVRSPIVAPPPVVQVVYVPQVVEKLVEVRGPVEVVYVPVNTSPDLAKMVGTLRLLALQSLLVSGLFPDFPEFAAFLRGRAEGYSEAARFVESYQ